jgi:hypothetical protein
MRTNRNRGARDAGVVPLSSDDQQDDRLQRDICGYHMRCNNFSRRMTAGWTVDVRKTYIWNILMNGIITWAPSRHENHQDSTDGPVAARVDAMVSVPTNA